MAQIKPKQRKNSRPSLNVKKGVLKPISTPSKSLYLSKNKKSEKNSENRLIQGYYDLKKNIS